jgi:hypothetical protein
MPRFVIATIDYDAGFGGRATDAHVNGSDYNGSDYVDKSARRLSVAIDGSLRYQWPVSTALWGYSTPNGSYRPERLARKWFSRKYDWSPMPYSIFFDCGYAIHGSYEIAHLGRPASHGCIRLHPQNAATLFALIKEHMGETSIVVTGQAPTPSGGKWPSNRIRLLRDCSAANSFARKLMTKICKHHELAPPVIFRRPAHQLSSSSLLSAAR